MSNEIYLFKDTETTGFKKSGSLIQDGQARVCQIALLLVDSTGKPLTQFSSLIKPDGWVIGEGAQKVHGITMEQCERFGLGAKSVVALYQKLAAVATLIVCHNSEFDQGMMEIEEEYAQPSYKKVTTKRFCTMKTNTHITPDGKWPKLEAAVKHYCNRAPTAAHDALGDAIDCRDVYFAMHPALKVAV